MDASRRLPHVTTHVVPYGDGGFDVEAFHRDLRVAHAWCSWVPDARRVLLKDIAVLERVGGWWQRLARRSHRRRGIGTLLLRIVVEEASHRGATEVCGAISRTDAMARPYVVPWYRSHGFVVEPSHGGHPSMDVGYTFSRKLP